MKNFIPIYCAFLLLVTGVVGVNVHRGRGFTVASAPAPAFPESQFYLDFTTEADVNNGNYVTTGDVADNGATQGVGNLQGTWVNDNDPCIDMDGTDDRAEMISADSNPDENDFSCAAWVKSDTGHNGDIMDNRET